MSNIVHFVTTEVVELFTTYMSHVVIAVLLATITGYVVLWRERSEWRNAAFLSRINISLNLVHDGALKIRTLLEADVRNVVLSSYARRLIKKAACATSIEDPFLSFANTQDAWMVYNELLNTISGIYGTHFLAAAIQQPDTAEERFLMALTWERDSDVKVQKLRVLLIQESTLDKITAEQLAKRAIRLEVASHETRLGTLQSMQKQYARGAWPDFQFVYLPRY